jgi:SAM-dependent methyltransferase
MTTAIAFPTTVADLIEEYAAKDAAIEESIAAFDRAYDALGMSATVRGTYVEPIGSKSYLYPASLRKNLLISGWRAVYERLRIKTIASANDRKLFDRALASPPPLTMENAKATFGDYLIRPRFHILRGLAEVFTGLDAAYKSHSKVRIGVKGLPKRVILNGWTGSGGFGRGYGHDLFQNMANALAAVREQPGLEWIEMIDLDDQMKTGDAVMDGRTLTQTVHGGEDRIYQAPNRGLTVRRFGNGNAHVFFDQDALLAVNRGLAEFYGEVLPDAEPEGVRPTASTAVSKDLQFYWTSAAVAEEALNFAGLPSPQSYSGRYPARRVLEPSCGDGRILDAIRARGHDALGIEYHPGRAAEARAKGHAVLTANFLEEPATADFDTVIMNPPFYGRHYLLHVRHALGFVKPGGTLVAILPATARYDHGELSGSWRDLPVASFADSGTNVPTTMLRISKPR